MRNRINRACVASSSNYAQSKKLHKAMLQENHDNNSSLFVMINTSLTPKTLTSLEVFENNLKKQIEEFKANRAV